MTDRELIEAFESCTLDPGRFDHRQHVRVAWICLREAPLVPALMRFVESLRRFATNAGSPGLYHETITFAFLFLIHERMQKSAGVVQASGLPCGRAERQAGGPHHIMTFDEFAEANPDLFGWKPSILGRYYRTETLESDLARRTFLMPDAL